MKQKYTYSMPEDFMQDQSVPAHWRLLGILNGFFINGLEVYASNSWFQEQLGCSQTTVTRAIATLEEMGKIRCKRTKRSRVITVGGSHERLGGYAPMTISDSHERLPNSDSNSDNKIPVEATASKESDLPIEVVPDIPESPRKKLKPATNKVKAVVNVFAEVLGKKEAYWSQYPKERQAAENLYNRKEDPEESLRQVRKALEGYLEHKEEQFCPKIYSPSDLDSKWSQLYNHVNKE